MCACVSSVDVLLKAVGDTPIMKTKKWAVERGRTVQSLSQFIARFLKLDASEQLVRIRFRPESLLNNDLVVVRQNALYFMLESKCPLTPWAKH